MTEVSRISPIFLGLTATNLQVSNYNGLQIVAGMEKFQDFEHHKDAFIQHPKNTNLPSQEKTSLLKFQCKQKGCNCSSEQDFDLYMVTMESEKLSLLHIFKPGSHYVTYFVDFMQKEHTIYKILKKNTQFIVVWCCSRQINCNERRRQVQFNWSDEHKDY